MASLSSIRSYINSLNNPTESDFNKGESLYSLMNNPLFSGVLFNELKECYFNEDYNHAFKLLDSMFTPIETNNIKKIKTRYDSKQLHASYLSHRKAGEFYSFCEDVNFSTSHEYFNIDPLLLIELESSNNPLNGGYNTSWNKAIRELERLESFDEFSAMNRDRIAKFRRMLKRKARLSNDKLKHVSKKGKVSKYQKRSPIVLPSSLIS